MSQEEKITQEDVLEEENIDTSEETLVEATGANEEKEESKKEEKKVKKCPEELLEEKLSALREQLDKLIEAKEENRFLTDALRGPALLKDDLERKRKILDEVKDDPNTELIREISPLLLGFNSAIRESEKSRNFDNVVSGIEKVYDEIHEIFKRFNVSPIEAENLEFDPNLHEAMMIENRNDIPFSTTVVQDFEKGYMMNDVVIRHSKVKVAKKSS